MSYVGIVLAIKQNCVRGIHHKTMENYASSSFWVDVVPCLDVTFKEKVWKYLNISNNRPLSSIYGFPKGEWGISAFFQKFQMSGRERKTLVQRNRSSLKSFRINVVPPVMAGWRWLNVWVRESNIFFSFTHFSCHGNGF